MQRERHWQHSYNALDRPYQRRETCPTGILKQRDGCGAVLQWCRCFCIVYAVSFVGQRERSNQRSQRPAPLLPRQGARCSGNKALKDFHTIPLK